MENNEFKQPKHIFVPARMYFVTSNTLKRQHMTDNIKRIVLDEIILNNGALYRLYAAVVMPDHFHIMIFPLKQDDGECIHLSKIMNRIKGVSSRKAGLECSFEGSLWQRGYFDQIVHGDKGKTECFDYIVWNPVRAGLIERWDDYPFVWCKNIDKTREARALKGALLISKESIAESENNFSGDQP